MIVRPPTVRQRCSLWAGVAQRSRTYDGRVVDHKIIQGVSASALCRRDLVGCGRSSLGRLMSCVGRAGFAGSGGVGVGRPGAMAAARIRWWVGLQSEPRSAEAGGLGAGAAAGARVGPDVLRAQPDSADEVSVAARSAGPAYSALPRPGRRTFTIVSVWPVCHTPGLCRCSLEAEWRLTRVADGEAGGRRIPGSGGGRPRAGGRGNGSIRAQHWAWLASGTYWTRVYRAIRVSVASRTGTPPTSLRPSR